MNRKVFILINIVGEKRWYDSSHALKMFIEKSTELNTTICIIAIFIVML